MDWTYVIRVSIKYFQLLSYLTSSLVSNYLIKSTETGVELGVLPPATKWEAGSVLHTQNKRQRM